MLARTFLLAVTIEVAGTAGCSRWAPICEGPSPIWSVKVAGESGQTPTHIVWHVNDEGRTAIAIGAPAGGGTAAAVTIGDEGATPPLIATVADGVVENVVLVPGAPKVPAAIGIDQAEDVVVAWGTTSCLVAHYPRGSGTPDWKVRDLKVNAHGQRCIALAVSPKGEVAYMTFDEECAECGVSEAVTVLEPDGSKRWTKPVDFEYDFHPYLAFTHEGGLLAGGDVLVGSDRLEALLAGSDGHVVSRADRGYLDTLFSQRDGAIVALALDDPGYPYGPATVTKTLGLNTVLWSRSPPLDVQTIALTPTGDVVLGGTRPYDRPSDDYRSQALMVLSGATGRTIAGERSCSVRVAPVEHGYITLSGGRLTMNPIPRSL